MTSNHDTVYPAANDVGRHAGASEAGRASNATDFIRQIVEDDLRSGAFGGRVHTRFPPEPNGYLHIGHAKAICLNFDLAAQYGGRCNLRFDDTNPAKENTEYIEAMLADIRWLGYDWGERVYYASDYFEQLYTLAEELIRRGRAYVCDLGPEEIRAYRGTLTRPGTDSPYRNRSVAENLALFRRMRAGEFAEGTRTLRAKIDMAAPNPVMRDPVLYRILKAPHHRTGTHWPIYPLYDFAHALSDAIEGITYSISTLEFENNHPLYHWILDQLGQPHPRRLIFARLSLTYTLTSKRRLRHLVEHGVVRGWDDPRLPTLSGLRRRGCPPGAIRAFIGAVGLARANSVVDPALLEHFMRQELNRCASRRMAVLRPLKLIIDDYPAGQVEQLEAVNNPEDAAAGTRKVPFSRELAIEREDFAENPPPGYRRLAPGREVRLRYAYYVTCTGVVRDPATGEVAEVHCTHDSATRGGRSPDGRTVRATLHWVSAAHAIPAEVRLYERLCTVPNPSRVAEGGTFMDNIAPHSLEILRGCLLEPALAEAPAGERFQFERLGYFCVDADSAPGQPVFNRTVALRGPGRAPSSD
jgi:glutaminyl-tRNA synthetase